MTNTYTIEEQEARFQEAYDHWLIYKDKESSDEIWLRVYEACKAMAKKKIQVSLSDDIFHDRLMKAVETVIKYILYDHNNRKRQTVPPTRPRKLITFVAWPVIAAFQGPEARREDIEMSYEGLIEKSESDLDQTESNGSNIEIYE